MQGWIVKKEDFDKLLLSLSNDYAVLVPSGEDEYLYKLFSEKESFIYNKYRAIDSLRQFYISSFQHLDDYYEGNYHKDKPLCIVGAKSCDLHSLIIQDYVFLSEPVDADYKYRRDTNLIISSDCSEFKDVCFCLKVGINPYPEKFFDLNISLTGGGDYFVESGSDKGRRIVQSNVDLFKVVDEKYLKQRERARNKLVEKMSEMLERKQIVSKDRLYDLVKNGYDNALWQEQALKCVECGACIMNCPTCHCFLLFDEKKSEDRFVRGRIWDGCQYKNFSRVAGGANPLNLRAKRLRNRYIKKFEFFPENMGEYACTGCGRCIECCPAKIDIRDIFKELASTKEKIHNDNE